MRQHLLRHPRISFQTTVSQHLGIGVVITVISMTKAVYEEHSDWAPAPSFSGGANDSN
jgi:hypothetical protein